MHHVILLIRHGGGFLVPSSVCWLKKHKKAQNTCTPATYIIVILLSHVLGTETHMLMIFVLSTVKLQHELGLISFTLASEVSSHAGFAPAHFIKGQN